MRDNFIRAAIWSITLVAAGGATVARADVVYDDTVQGDLSNDYLNPTPVALTYGLNSVIVAAGVTPVLDLDLMRIDLPADAALEYLYLASYANETGRSFIAFNVGPQLLFNPDPDTGNPFDCLTYCNGFSHFGPSETLSGAVVGADLLPILKSASEQVEGPGFDIPLTGSQYTFWMQDNTAEELFQLDFYVSLPGDYNDDFTVNAADYTVWRNTLHQNVTPGEEADGDRDGEITQNDFQIWKSHYGDVAVGFGAGAGAESIGSTVPEPGTAALLALGVAVAGALRARRRTQSAELI
jgi:hypothetical protein